MKKESKQDPELIDYSDKLAAYLKLENEKSSSEHKKLEPYEFFASQAGMCSRKLYYDKLGFSSPLTTDTLGIFEIGNILHKYLQTTIFGGKEYASEYPIILEEGDIKVRGRIDCIGNKKVIEIKSTSTFGDVLTPKPLNLMQNNLYLSKFQDYKGVLLYVSKFNLKVTTFEFDFDKQLYDLTINKFFSVYLKIALRELPPAEHSEQCKYCEYKNTKCINNEN